MEWLKKKSTITGQWKCAHILKIRWVLGKHTTQFDTSTFNWWQWIHYEKGVPMHSDDSTLHLG